MSTFSHYIRFPHTIDTILVVRLSVVRPPVTLHIAPMLCFYRKSTLKIGNFARPSILFTSNITL